MSAAKLGELSEIQYVAKEEFNSKRKHAAYGIRRFVSSQLQHQIRKMEKAAQNHLNVIG